MIFRTYSLFYILDWCFHILPRTTVLEVSILRLIVNDARSYYSVGTYLQPHLRENQWCNFNYLFNALFYDLSLLSLLSGVRSWSNGIRNDSVDGHGGDRLANGRALWLVPVMNPHRATLPMCFKYTNGHTRVPHIRARRSRDGHVSVDLQMAATDTANRLPHGAYHLPALSLAASRTR